MIDLLPAFDLAARWHAGQFRKGVAHEPFFHHPLRVAGYLIQYGIHDPLLINAALSHDLLEDTACPPEKLEKALGWLGLKIVHELTDRKELLKSMRKQMQVERAGMLSPEAKLIRLADKIDNVASLQTDPPEKWSWQRIREYVAWADRVVKNMGPVHPALENKYWQSSREVWQWATGQPPENPGKETC